VVGKLVPIHVFALHVTKAISWMRCHIAVSVETKVRHDVRIKRLSSIKRLVRIEGLIGVERLKKLTRTDRQVEVERMVGIRRLFVIESLIRSLKRVKIKTWTVNRGVRRPHTVVHSRVVRIERLRACSHDVRGIHTRIRSLDGPASHRIDWPPSRRGAIVRTTPHWWHRVRIGCRLHGRHRVIHFSGSHHSYRLPRSYRVHRLLATYRVHRLSRMPQAGLKARPTVVFSRPVITASNTRLTCIALLPRSADGRQEISLGANIRQIPIRKENLCQNINVEVGWRVFLDAKQRVDVHLGPRTGCFVGGALHSVRVRKG
jgi:hypothetical protein